VEHPGAGKGDRVLIGRFSVAGWMPAFLPLAPKN